MSDADRLFLLTTRRLAPPGLARSDVRTALALVGDARPLADLGCGYGRHLRALEEQGVRGALGVDRSALLLRTARDEAPSARLLQADLRALPLAESALGAAFCFYSSMFLGTDDDALAALREVRRTLRPGGRFVLTTDNPLRLGQGASFAEDIPGLGHVSEESQFADGLDVVERTLRRENGEVLSATFRIRYYLPAALEALARAAGLALVRLEPDAPLTLSTPQLVALFARP